MKHNLRIFEGMHFEQRYLLPLILILLVLSIFTSGLVTAILILLFLLSTAYYAIRLYGRIKQRWCRIHFPGMVRFHYASGIVMGAQANPQWREFLQMYTNSIFPQMAPTDAESYVSLALAKLSTAYDKNAIQELLLRKEPPLPASKLDSLVENQLAHMSKEDNQAMQLRAIIAQVIEDTYGSEERKKYIQALLTNEAF